MILKPYFIQHVIAQRYSACAMLSPRKGNPKGCFLFWPTIVIYQKALHLLPPMPAVALFSAVGKWKQCALMGADLGQNMLPVCSLQQGGKVFCMQ